MSLSLLNSKNWSTTYAYFAPAFINFWKFVATLRLVIWPPTIIRQVRVLTYEYHESLFSLQFELALLEALWDCSPAILK